MYYAWLMFDIKELLYKIPLIPSISKMEHNGNIWRQVAKGSPDQAIFLREMHNEITYFPLIMQ